MADRDDTAVPPPQEEVNATTTEETTTTEEQPAAAEDTTTKPEEDTTAAEVEGEKKEGDDAAAPAEGDEQPEGDAAATEVAAPPAEGEEQPAATEEGEQPAATEEEPAVEEEEAPKDPLDDPEATTAREQELQDRIAKLREQIDERKKRHAECLEEKASKEDHLAEIKSNIEQTEDRLDVTTMNVQHLRQLEDRARIVAGKLERSDNFLERVAAWVSGPFSQESGTSQQMHKRSVEVEILTHIQELQHKRASKIRDMGSLNKKINDNKRHIRQQHQREPRKKNEGFTEILTPQAKDYERCSSPRRSQVDEDPDTVRLQSACKDSEDELRLYQGRMRNALAQRSDITIEINTKKLSADRSQAELKSAIKQKELSTSHDQRKCTELETKNAAIISTLEVQIKALKLLHYGAAGGPTTERMALNQ